MTDLQTNYDSRIPSPSIFDGEGMPKAGVSRHDVGCASGDTEVYAVAEALRDIKQEIKFIFILISQIFSQKISKNQL